MPRRKQGHPHAYKCATGAGERGSRGRSRGRSATASRLSGKSFGSSRKKGVRNASPRSRGTAMRPSGATSGESPITPPDDEERYLHKKFQRADCRSPNVSGRASNAEGKETAETGCDPGAKTHQSKALEALLKVTELEIIKSSTQTRGQERKNSEETTKNKAGKHVCHYCNNTFAKPNVLEKHVRVHTDERPFPCSLCGFAFKTKSNLYKHKKSRAHTLKANEMKAGESSASSPIDSNGESDEEKEVSESTVQRVPPIKMQTLLHNNHIVSVIPPKEADETKSEEKDEAKTTTWCRGIGSTVYKPKFHSAFFGESRKFTEERNPMAEVPEEPDEVIEAAKVNDDGLMLRMLDEDISASQSKEVHACKNNNNEVKSKSKSTRLASPEYLKQHISNIISRNTAIVETLNPLWSRRFLRQSSVASSQNVDAELRARDKNSVQSKLANALLRQDQNGCLMSGSQSLPATPSIMGLTSPRFLMEVQNKVLAATSIIECPPTPTPTTPLRPTPFCHGPGINQAILSPTSSMDETTVEMQAQENQQHPQNPEGSIIKNLLLTKRHAAINTNAIPSIIVSAGTQGVVVNDSSPKSEVLTTPVAEQLHHHVCPMCRTSFRSPETLLAHQNHYCKKSQAEHQLSLGEYSEKCQKKKLERTATPKPRGRPKGSKNRPKESSVVNCAKVQSPTSPACASPFVYSFSMNDTHGKALNALKGKLVCRQLSDGDTGKIENKETDAGAILKKQLLLGGDKSPPLKKRKISEEVLAIEENKSVVDGQGTTTSTLRSLEELSRYPMKTNALQMFGGKMQIFNGNDHKKIRIDTQMQQSQHRSGGLLTTSMSTDDGDPANISPNNLSSSSTVVVTIAKPVHNSGGTMMQMHDSKVNATPSVCIPVVALGQPMLDNSPEHMPKFNQMGAVVLSSSVPPISPLPLQPHSFYSIDISHLQINGAAATTSKSTSPLPSPIKMKNPPSALTLPCPFPSAAQEAPPVTPAVEANKPIEKSLPTIKIHNMASKVESSPTTPTTPPTTKGEEKPKSLLAPPPTRPTSLALKSLGCSMTGTTLISPETPRNKKKCGELYMNGQYYTNLVLKCSTHVCYCCLHPPQPMYVPQDTDSKLSMYSNWQTVPTKAGDLNPVTAMACYNNQQRNISGYAVAGANNMEYMLTHSSYWSFKQHEKKKDEMDVDKTEGLERFDSQAAQIEEPTSPAKENICTEKEEGESASVEAEMTNQLRGKHKNKELFAESTTREPKRVRIFEGGYKSNEDYTYIRGRGRGKYVCEECGIRCKKPSMLKKHIRTHTDVRPFTCKHCNFSFKTKGNLTKHMKSKAHHKKCVELGIDPVPVSIDDAHIDEEALAKQERYEKEFGKFTDDDDDDEEDEEEDEEEDMDDDDEDDAEEDDEDDDEMDIEKCAIDSRKRFTVDVVPGQFDDAAEENAYRNTNESNAIEKFPAEEEVARSLLDLSNHGKGDAAEPVQEARPNLDPSYPIEKKNSTWTTNSNSDFEQHPAQPTSVIHPPQTVCGSIPQAEYLDTLPYESETDTRQVNDELIGNPRVVWQPGTHKRLIVSNITPDGHARMSPVGYVGFPPDREIDTRSRKYRGTTSPCVEYVSSSPVLDQGSLSLYPPDRDTNLVVYLKPKDKCSSPLLECTPHFPRAESFPAIQAMDGKAEASGSDEPMDLSVGSGMRMGFSQPYQEDANYPFCVSPRLVEERRTVVVSPIRENNLAPNTAEMYEAISPPPTNYEHSVEEFNTSPTTYNQSNGSRLVSLSPLAVDPAWEMGEPAADRNCSMLHAYLTEKQCEIKEGKSVNNPVTENRIKPLELSGPQSMVVQTSSSASIYLGGELLPSTLGRTEFLMPLHRSMDDGKCVCNICNKHFTKSSQLRLHVNIHYFERPFRCDSCAVSFRTKGHLQKHKRSVSHYNKVNMNMTFGTPTTDNPRPFKCIDCKIAFRIHGHLAKHLRSKMHIMKLECLGKLPFGTYAEIERSGINLSEIDTTDCENSLDSLRVMAQRFYEKDPRKQIWTRERTVSGCSTDDGSDIVHVADEPAESSNRYRSLSLNDVGNQVSPNGDNEDLLVIPRDARTIPRVKHETSHEGGRSDAYRQDVSSQQPSWQQMMRQPSVESLGQEYEDISDDELESDVIASCSLCHQVFKDVKTLQLHLYMDHPEARDAAARPPRPQLHNSRIRSISLNADTTSETPGDVAVAMEIRRNTLSENAAIAMEMRRTNSFSGFNHLSKLTRQYQ